MKTPLALFVLVVAFISTGVIASDENTVRRQPSAGAAPAGAEREGAAPRKQEPSAGEREGAAPRKQKPDGCGDTFWGCWFDESGAACEPQSTANGCAFDYEASLQAASLRDDDDDGKPTLVDLIEDVHKGAAVPSLVAKHVAKEVCRITQADSVSIPVQGDTPTGADSVRFHAQVRTLAAGREHAPRTDTYNCSRWFDVD